MHFKLNFAVLVLKIRGIKFIINSPTILYPIEDVVIRINWNAINPCVLYIYACETWSDSLMKEDVWEYIPEEYIRKGSTR